MENNTREYYTIDFTHIAKFVWGKVWLVILSGVLATAIGFYISSVVIEPTYASSILLYVNNTSSNPGNAGFSMSSSEISAAQSLVKTYGEILNNRTTLERVIEKASLPYTNKQLAHMIVTAPSNDTEVMLVKVTCTDPYEAARIANCIAEVLPVRISEIIDGASVEIVDYAVPNLEKVAPNVAKQTSISLMLGILLSLLVLIVAAMMDDTIHSEEYVIQNYEYPILAKVPDLLDSGNKRYGYYYHYRSHSKSQNN